MDVDGISTHEQIDQQVVSDIQAELIPQEAALKPLPLPPFGHIVIASGKYHLVKEMYFI